MGTATNVRNKLTNLFNLYGTDVTVSALTSSNDSRGDSVQSWATAVTVKAFMKDTSKGINFNKAISFNFDGYDIVLPYNTTVDIGYKIVVAGVTYQVTNYHYTLFANGDTNSKVLVGAELKLFRSL